jgi:GTP cyclohydrolase I
MNLPLPDVALAQIEHSTGTLDWIGMKGIALPLKLFDKSGHVLGDYACVHTFVNISDARVKGIHMSRLYALLGELSHAPVRPQDLCALAERMLNSHADISDALDLHFTGNFLLERPALLSDNKGWRLYPFKVRLNLMHQTFTFELSVQIAYSSSCPCSAALSRQLLQREFLDNFHDQQLLDKSAVNAWLGAHASHAIPHSQRSYADVTIKLQSKENQFPFIELIDLVESAINVPVQTLVKREDEQAFARLSGQHQQFCEDAARKLKRALNQCEYILDFWLQVDHQESLHAHNAVAITTKGVKDGYQPLHHFLTLSQPS